MRHIIISIALILTVFGAAFGQEEKSSKYKSISRRNLKLDKSVPLLLEEAKILMNNDKQAALDKVEEALALSITQKSSFNEASCYLVLGHINEQIHEWSLAYEQYRKAYDLLSVDHTRTDIYKESLDGIIKTEIALRHWGNALSFINQKINEADTPERKVEGLLSLSDVHFYMQDYPSSQKDLVNAQVVIEEYGLSGKTSAVKSREARIMVQMDDVETAENLFQESQAAESAQDAQYVAALDEVYIEEIKEEIINVYDEQDRVEDEIDLRNKSIATNQLKGKSLKVVKEKQALSKTYIKTGNTQAGLKELEDAIILADSINDQKQLANAYLAVAEIKKQARDTDGALIAYENYAEAIAELRKEELRKAKDKKEVIRKQQDISSLTKEIALDESQYELEKATFKLKDNQLKLQRLIIYGLAFLLIIALVAAWIVYRKAKESHMRGQLLALKSLRSQMNPHFIFNALNSVNQFIAVSDERSANKFLSEFAKLMRLVLDNSQHDFISLAEEKEILSLYMKLEHNRFRDKFDYSFNVDENLALEKLELPPMLIQPYIENAIWHGLRYKISKGHLTVDICEEKGVLLIYVIDDGIGRKESLSLKTDQQKKHRSVGLKNAQERIRMINKVYNRNYSVSVMDINPDGSGTQVKIELPQPNH